MGINDRLVVVATILFLIALAFFWNFQPDGNLIEPSQIVRR